MHILYADEFVFFLIPNIG